MANKAATKGAGGGSTEVSYGTLRGGVDVVGSFDVGAVRLVEHAFRHDPPTPAELRRQFGSAISDEELLLRAHMPTEQVDAMLAADPTPNHFNPDLAPVLRLLGELGERRTVHDLAVAKANLRLSVHRNMNRSTEGATRA